MTLAELTGHESGIICYGEDTVAVFNWSSCGEDQFPALDPFGFGAFPWDEEEGWADGVTKERTNDFRDILPGSIWLTEATDETGTKIADTDLNILYDQNSDLLQAFLAPKISLAADVFRLSDGRLIITPDDFE